MHYTSNQIFQKIGMITKSKLPETSILIDKIHIYQKLQYIMGLKKYKKFHVLKKSSNTQIEFILLTIIYDYGHTKFPWLGIKFR